MIQLGQRLWAWNRDRCNLLKLSLSTLRCRCTSCGPKTGRSHHRYPVQWRILLEKLSSLTKTLCLFFCLSLLLSLSLYSVLALPCRPKTRVLQQVSGAALPPGETLEVDLAILPVLKQNKVLSGHSSKSMWPFFQSMFPSCYIMTHAQKHVRGFYQ